MRSLKPKFFVNFFIYKRIRNARYRKIIGKSISKLRSNSSACITTARIKPYESKNMNINPACRKLTIKWPVGKRFIVKPKSYHLPPNRYSLPPPLGYKGAFISRLPRTTQSVTHLHSMKKIDEYKFYDLSSFVDTLKSKCCYYKGVFGSNPRLRKPSTRAMTHNTNFAVSPMLGPTSYLPTNHCLGQKEMKKTITPMIYKFLPNSSVPEPDMSIYRNNVYFGADPTIYYPYHIATCPMPGRCDPDIAYKIEMNNINKSRRLPYSKFLVNLKVGSTFEQNVKGHGHTSKFRCPLKCDHSQLFVKRMTKELVFNYHPVEYFKMITNPNRKQVSFRQPDELLSIKKQFKFKYMATQKPVIRKKLLETPNLAFGTTQPRFSGELKTKEVDEPKQKTKPIKIKKKIAHKKEVNIKLYDIPSHRAFTVNETVKRVSKLVQYKYSKEPPTKILLEHNYIGDFGNKRLQQFLKDVPYEQFFKRRTI